MALGEWVQGHEKDSEPFLLCHFQGLSTLKRFAPPCLPSSLEDGYLRRAARFAAKISEDNRFKPSTPSTPPQQRHVELERRIQGWRKQRMLCVQPGRSLGSPMSKYIWKRATTTRKYNPSSTTTMATSDGTASSHAAATDTIRGDSGPTGPPKYGVKSAKNTSGTPRRNAGRGEGAKGMGDRPPPPSHYTQEPRVLLHKHTHISLRWHNKKKANGGSRER